VLLVSAARSYDAAAFLLDDARTRRACPRYRRNDVRLKGTSGALVWAMLDIFDSPLSWTKPNRSPDAGIAPSGASPQVIPR
jgi:hypothetical protein